MLQVEDHEIRHLNILAWLFNLNENHNLDDRVLKRFLLHVANDSANEDAIDENIQLIDLQQASLLDAEVLREKNRIDILIVSRNSNLVVVIENKIYSTEHLNQLSRYYKTTKEKYSHFKMLLIYLALFGDKSSHFRYYSNSACQNYNVRYAVAASPLGSFTYKNRVVVQRDNSRNILGPGHNSILEYKGNWYICYHRQHYQYIDVKRQTCIDQITVEGDNISVASQTQEGVWDGSGALESLVAASRAKREMDLAFGKTVVASSESAFKGGTSQNQKENLPAIDKVTSGKSNR